jgi:hypothetical protein
VTQAKEFRKECGMLASLNTGTSALGVITLLAKCGS